MTRKDHQLIAGAVRSMEITAEMKLVVARTLARALASTNARFDATRFTDACVCVVPWEANAMTEVITRENVERLLDAGMIEILNFVADGTPYGRLNEYFRHKPETE